MSKKPRTCCTTHADRCRFGGEHVFSGPFIIEMIGNPPTFQWSHPDDAKCATCGGICYGNRADAELPAEHVERASS